MSMSQQVVELKETETLKKMKDAIKLLPADEKVRVIALFYLF